MPPKAKPVFDRFWKYVKKTNDCWLWIGCKAKSGYGVLSINNQAIGAHRISYWLAHGIIPQGLHVCHICDNPPCVRPSHLFLGTMKDNIQDASRKGRMHPGEKHGMAKLTVKDVRAIRNLYPRFTQLRIAKMFGVSRGCIGDIVRNVNWAIVPSEIKSRTCN